MNMTDFIRRWGSRVSYLRPASGAMSFTSATSNPLPAEAAEDLPAASERVPQVEHPPFTTLLRVANDEFWTCPGADVTRAVYRDGKPVVKFSWEPIAGEFLLVPPGQQHASVGGARPFEDYVRGIILRDRRLVTLRPFWPTWVRAKGAYSDFDADAAEVSFDAQEACERVMVKHGARGWDFRFNITSAALEALTGIYAKLW